MSDTGTPQGRRPGARSRVRGEPANTPSAGTSEPLADPSGKLPAGSPSEGGPVEPDASENAFWLVSAGYQLVQMRQAAEQQRAQMLDEARHQRPDLTDAEFAVLTDHEFPLAVPFVATAEQVLAYLDAARPRGRRRRSPTGGAGRPRLQEPALREELQRVLAELRDEGEDRPTRAQLAEHLGIEPATFRRRLQRFPELRTLLPMSGRPRRIDRT
jgi:hypothetical protein